MDNFTVKLASLRSEDSSALFSWINDREQVLFNSPYRPVHELQHLEWFQSIQTRSDLAIFSIRTKLNDELIGTCQLHSINDVSRSAELQIRLGATDQRGQGFGTQAVQLLLEFGFKDLNLHRIFLHVFSDNDRAIRVYEKVGFSNEGLLRDAVYIDGMYKDVKVMSLLNYEYFTK